MAQLVTEWVNVADNISIIARELEGLVHTPNGTKEIADPFAMPMTGVGSPGSTVGLLDGAINLAFTAIEKRLARPEPTVAGYIVALVGAYHTSVDTPRNLRRAASRFNDMGRPEVAAYLEERAREETGHDRLALKDLRALGVPGERLVANYIPDGIKPLCKRFDDLCAEDYPIGSIGYSYSLERIAALKQEADIARVRALCPDGIDTTRFLRSHSSLGSEASHVAETIEFVSPFLRMTASRSYRRRMNCHCSWRRDTITSSSNPRPRCSKRFGRRSEKRSRMVVVQPPRPLKGTWLDLWRERLAQSSSQSGMV